MLNEWCSYIICHSHLFFSKVLEFVLNFQPLWLALGWKKCSPNAPIVARIVHRSRRHIPWNHMYLWRVGGPWRWFVGQAQILPSLKLTVRPWKLTFPKGNSSSNHPFLGGYFSFRAPCRYHVTEIGSYFIVGEWLVSNKSVDLSSIPIKEPGNIWGSTLSLKELASLLSYRPMTLLKPGTPPGKTQNSRVFLLADLSASETSSMIFGKFPGVPSPPTSSGVCPLLVESCSKQEIRKYFQGDMFPNLGRLRCFVLQVQFHQEKQTADIHKDHQAFMV